MGQGVLVSGCERLSRARPRVGNTFEQLRNLSDVDSGFLKSGTDYPCDVRSMGCRKLSDGRHVLAGDGRSRVRSLVAWRSTPGVGGIRTVQGLTRLAEDGTAPQ